MVRFSKEILKPHTGLCDTAGNPVTILPSDLNRIRDAFYEELEGYGPGKVWIPFTHLAARTADPRDNAGFVMDLDVVNGEGNPSLVATIDVEDVEAVGRIKNQLARDVSVGLIKTKSGRWVLQHLALTTDPALTDLGSFTELSSGQPCMVVLSKGLSPFKVTLEKIAAKEVDLEMADEASLPLTIEEQVKEKEAEGEMWDVLFAFETAAFNIATNSELDMDAKKSTMGTLIDELKGYVDPLIERFADKAPAPTEEPAETVEEPATETEPETEASKETVAQKVLSRFGIRSQVNLKRDLQKRDEANKQLSVELSEANEALELIAAEKTSQEAARQKVEWNAVFDSFIGKKVVPSERDLLLERISDPEKLRLELEARGELVEVSKSLALGAELQNTAAKDSLIEDLTEDEVGICQRNGWIDENLKVVAGKEKYVKVVLEARGREITTGKK